MQPDLRATTIQRGIQPVSRGRTPGAAEIRVDAAAQILGAQVDSRSGGERKPDRPVYRGKRDRMTPADALEIGLEIAIHGR